MKLPVNRNVFSFENDNVNTVVSMAHPPSHRDSFLYTFMRFCVTMYEQ